MIATGHHAPPEGAVAVIDPSRGANEPEARSYVTPSCDALEGGPGSSPAVAEGGVPDRGGLYRTPWPLSEESFLVPYASSYPRRMAYAAYYIDEDVEAAGDPGMEERQGDRHRVEEDRPCSRASASLDHGLRHGYFGGILPP